MRRPYKMVAALTITALVASALNCACMASSLAPSSPSSNVSHSCCGRSLKPNGPKNAPDRRSSTCPHCQPAIAGENAAVKHLPDLSPCDFPASHFAADHPMPAAGAPVCLAAPSPPTSRTTLLQLYCKLTT